jgi:hypothetical protein
MALIELGEVIVEGRGAHDTVKRLDACWSSFVTLYRRRSETAPATASG